MDEKDKDPTVSEVQDATPQVDETEQAEQHDTPEEVTEDAAPLVATEATVNGKKSFKQRLHNFGHYYKTHKKTMIPVTVLLVLGLLLAVPISRYPLLGTVVKKDVNVVILDAKTDKPVSSADLQLNGKSAKTDQAGKVTFSKVSIGNHKLEASKKYYISGSKNIFVGISNSGNPDTLKLRPTGRQVKVKVVDVVTGKGVKSAKLSVADTEAKTDDNGDATIVLPADKDSQDAKISSDGFNTATSTIKVVEGDTVAVENTISVTPAGKIYFLSKRTGKINVMKSDLDGKNATVVLAATGNEDDGDTILLASQDWKYLALKSKRDGASKPASLYLIDTANNDKLTTMDEGNATFTLTGWSNHTFVYQVQRDSVKDWQPNRQSLKSYNAENAKLNVLDNTGGEGSGNATYYGTDYKAEYFGSVILVGNVLTYSKAWIAGIYTPGGEQLAGKQSGIYSVGVDGGNKKTLKSFDAFTTSSIEGKLYEPNEVYYRVYNKDKAEYYALENGVVSTKGDLAATFNGFYPTYLFSPNNQQTFWAEPRDGKNTLFVGDAKSDNAKTVNELSEYTAYGWFTGDYLLISKNSSELYIIGSVGLQGNAKPLKITDYHKPNVTFYGYGGGYGGL